MLERWGRFAARRHWTVILAWLVVVGGVWAAAIALGGEAQNDFPLPGSSSQDALALLEDEFPPAAGTSATVVYHSPAGTDMTQDTGLQQAIQAKKEGESVTLRTEEPAPNPESTAPVVGYPK